MEWIMNLFYILFFNLSALKVPYNVHVSVAQDDNDGIFVKMKHTNKFLRKENSLGSHISSSQLYLL